MAKKLTAKKAANIVKEFHDKGWPLTVHSEPFGYGCFFTTTSEFIKHANGKIDPLVGVHQIADELSKSDVPHTAVDGCDRHGTIDVTYTKYIIL